MKMHEIAFSGPPPIDGYGEGGFRVGGLVHEGGLLILPRRLTRWSPAGALSREDFAPIIDAADEIDLLIVGTGREIAPLPGELRAWIEAAGVGVEVMATGAACRTYNVLIAEERRVAAALAPV